MTVQAKDSFYYEGERYCLLDVSDNKMLTCKKCAGDMFGSGYSTGCYRGTIAGYDISDGVLTLKETADVSGFGDVPAFSVFRGEGEEQPTPPKYQPGTVIPFTGRLIIYQGGLFMDFFGSIFNADKALELEFDEGLFVGATDLTEFIRIGNDCEEVLSSDPEKLIKTMSRESSVIPLGHYTDSTYVWRYDTSECVLCGSANATESE